MRFQTTIELGGKTATGFRVPDDVVTHLGSGKRPAVRVTINGHTYRSTVAPYSGACMIALSAENRELAGVAAGDEVEVELELDTEPREVTVPPDVAEALHVDVTVREAFNALSYSNKRQIVLRIEEAKAPETRQRRIARAIISLREGQA